MPDIDLLPQTPVEMTGLTAGAAYSVLATIPSGSLLTEAESKIGTWEPLAALDNYYVPILPGTKLRFTLQGSVAGNVRVTPAA